MINKFFLVFVLLFFSTAQNSFAVPSRNMTIFAEPNMALALTKLARLFSQQSRTIVSVNFNSASDLITEIDSGEPADLFISAHPEWIESLRQKGLVDIYNIGYIAGDELVLATLDSNPNIPTELLGKKLSLEDSLKILNQNKALLIIDNVDNSAGYFSQNLLNKLNFSDIKLFAKLREDKSTFLTVARSHNENYTLTLRSQIKNEEDFKILATQKDENIFYQALVIAGDNMEVAREFVKFLKSDVAQEILKNGGFVID